MSWYRTIRPNEEVATLVRREFSAPQKQEPGNYNNDPNFIPLSSFQYLAVGTKQRIFSQPCGSKIGILLRNQEQPRTVYWRDSSYLSVADSIFKEKITKQEFSKRLEKHNFISVPENTIAPRVEKAYAKLISDYKKEKLNPQEAELNWTEGLFRYSFQDVKAVLIDPNSKENIISGLAFSKLCQSGKIPVSVGDFSTFKKLDTKKWEDKYSKDINKAVDTLRNSCQKVVPKKK